MAKRKKKLTPIPPPPAATPPELDPEAKNFWASFLKGSLLWAGSCAFALILALILETFLFGGIYSFLVKLQIVITIAAIPAFIWQNWGEIDAMSCGVVLHRGKLTKEVTGGGGIITFPKVHSARPIDCTARSIDIGGTHEFRLMAGRLGNSIKQMKAQKDALAGKPISAMPRPFTDEELLLGRNAKVKDAVKNLVALAFFLKTKLRATGQPTHLEFVKFGNSWEAAETAITGPIIEAARIAGASEDDATEILDDIAGFKAKIISHLETMYPVGGKGTHDERVVLHGWTMYTRHLQARELIPADDKMIQAVGDIAVTAEENVATASATQSLIETSKELMGLLDGVDIKYRGVVSTVIGILTRMFVTKDDKKQTNKP